jgi:hypothetical protein
MNCGHDRGQQHHDCYIGGLISGVKPELVLSLVSHFGGWSDPKPTWLRLEAGRLGHVLRFTVDDTAPDPFEVEAARFRNLTIQAIQCPSSYTVDDIDPLGQDGKSL